MARILVKRPKPTGSRRPARGLHGESASDVSSSSATFEATFAPHDAPTGEHDLQAPVTTPTSYYFQYNTQGTGACTAEPSACTSVPSSPVSAGSAPGDVEVSQHAAGLAANTTYHYRVVVVHEALPETKPGVLTSFYGPDQTFTTQGAGGPLVLPDGRAWELVSPAGQGRREALIGWVGACRGGRRRVHVLDGHPDRSFASG